jgi:hypothetical protein
MLNGNEYQPKAVSIAFGAHRSLICLAIVKKACSTLVAFFAEVSRKGMFS